MSDKIGLIDKLRILAKFNSTAKDIQNDMQTKNATKLFAAIYGLAAFLYNIKPIHSVIDNFISAHGIISGIVGLIVGLATLFHVPLKDATKAASVALLCLFLLSPGTLHAQTAAPSSDLPQNIYAFGPSYNPSASPAIAGTALYGRQLTAKTYGITVMDALPEPTKPFTISTNVGVGVARELVKFKSYPVYGSMGTGINWTGNDTNWQWNGGLLTAIPFHKACASCYLMPNFRFLSVGGGQYRPIAGFWFGFGQ